ncbi:MAG: hypothetical protein U0163_09975 [Gemmatimonadaceae bacterium]
MLRLLPILASIAWATTLGEVFGDLRLGDKYVADAPVQLKCGAEVVKGKTDQSGSFRLAAKGSGKCEFTVTYESKEITVDVVVFDKPARYRFLLEPKDGAYVLKRV